MDKTEYNSLQEMPPAQARIDRADELLARLIDDIGTGPALDRLRKDALRIKKHAARLGLVTSE